MVDRLPYLVTIAPEEVLGADVLVGVLGALRPRGLVSNVLPVSIPPDLSVHGSDDKGRDGNAVDTSLVAIPTEILGTVEWEDQCSRRATASDGR
jgi:hypothetical protein